MTKIVSMPDALSLLSSLPDPLLAIDEEGSILFANDASESFFGRSRTRMENQQVQSLFRMDGEELGSILKERERSVSAQNVRLHLNDGRVAQANLLLAPVQDHPGWRLLMIDPLLPEREFAGQATKPGEQAALGAPAVLGHEIKNPLAGIKGAAQLLAKKLDSKQRAMTDLIIAEVDRIARIIDQMQHLGRKGPANIGPNNIHVILDRAIQSLRAARPDLPQITISFDPSLPDVLVDKDAILQVLINLLQNAADALVDVENPSISVTTRYVLGGLLRQPDALGEDGVPIRLPIEVTIADNGPGVPKRIETELFSPFVTTKRDGQGLGLAIVRKLMRDMNGRIVYERDEQAGLTLFRVLMPMAGKRGEA